MREDRADFSRYGKAFQEGLVQLIFEDRPFADQITEVLDIQFIELEYLRLFATLIVDYREKYETHPSVDIMLVLLRTEIDNENEVVQSQTREYFAKIHTKELTDIKYIKETALDFCRKQNLKEAMMESVGLLQKCSFDEISTVINNALKSMALVHLGTQAIKEGKTVVHYTLELQDTVVASRYDSCLTGYPLSDIINFKEEIYEAIGDVDGSLIIKEYPTKSATTNTVRSHLSRLIKRGITPGLVIVDYADLLKPVIVRKEKRNELESIYEDLRGLSTEFKCPIWTASQTNRSGLSAEVITMEQISEAFNKCFVADFIFSISRTIEDKQNNQGKMFIAKNRNGPDGIIFPLFMDTSNVKIKILPPTTTAAVGSMPTQAPLGVKQQQTLLRQKYTKLRRK